MRAVSVWLNPEAAASVDSVLETIRAHHPRWRVSREGLVNEVLTKALEDPRVLRALGARGPSRRVT